MNRPDTVLKKLVSFFSAAAIIFVMTAAASVSAVPYSVGIHYGTVGAPSNAAGSLMTDEDSKEFKAAEKQIKNALNKFAPSADITAQVTKDDISRIFFNILVENKQYFYVASDITYTYSVSTGYVKTVNFHYIMDKNTVRKNRGEFNKKFKSLLSGIDKKWTDVQKCLYVHDKLAASCKYDTTVQPESYTAYGALVNGSAVCQGYSIAYAQLLGELGIECRTVYSLKDNHMWNCVRIDGIWYNIDVTYDDPLPDMTNRVLHCYFMKSNVELNKDKRHNSTSAEAGVLGWGTGYDKAFWNDVKSIMPVSANAIYYVTPKGEVSSHDVTTGKSGTIYYVTDIWKIYGTSSYYEGVFSGCALDGKNLYFNTSDSIYSFDTVKSLVKKEKTVSTVNGCLYGVRTDNGTVYGLIKSSPDSTSTEKWEKIL